MEMTGINIDATSEAINALPAEYARFPLGNESTPVRTIFSVYDKPLMAKLIDCHPTIKERALDGRLYRVGTTLSNHTKIPDAHIRTIIDFASPAPLPPFDCVVKYAPKEWSGYARCIPYTELKYKFKPFVTLSIPQPQWRLPHRSYWRKYQSAKIVRFDDHGHKIVYGGYQSKKGYLDCLHLTLDEAIVHLLAHELWHIWQYYYGFVQIHKMSRRQRERNADEYAIKKVREWRRKHALSDAEAALQRAGSFLFFKLAIAMIAIVRRCLA